MEKNKGRKNYLMLVLILFFTLASLALYKQSVGIKVLERVEYTENSGVNYKVHVNDLKYYNKEYLEEGKQYISGIIDYIDIYFNNKITFDNELDYEATKKIEANVKVVDLSKKDNVIYEKTEVLSKDDKIKEEKSKEINLNSNIKIDYKKYNELMNEFKSNYGISANCVLVVTYNATYQGKYKDFKDMNKITTMKVEIPLSEQMITINKTPDVHKDDAYEETTNTSIMNKTLFMISVLFIIVALMLAVKTIMEIIQDNKKLSKYEKFIRKTLKQYDSYITESKEVTIEGKDEVEVNSFKELLDVRNNIEKAIVYVKETEKESKFMIIDEKEVYIYSAKEEDFR